MSAKIIIHRQKAWLNKVRGVQVFIDGAQSGLIANGDSDEYIVEPGAHNVRCKMSWYQVPEMNFVLNEGETKFLKVSMGMKYFGVTYIILLLAIASTFIPRLAGFQKPEWLPWTKIAIITPVALYYIYYFTLGRKKYLLMEEDKDNIFK
jgi:hypothetical protein